MRSNDWNFTAILILIGGPLAMFVTGCQVKTTLLDTPEQGMHHSRFYIHPNYKKSSDVYNHKHFYVDGKEISDVKRLDKEGISLPEGDHEVVVTDDQNSKDIQKFTYRAVNGTEQHLIYCPENGRILRYKFTSHADLEKFRSVACATPSKSSPKSR